MKLMPFDLCDPEWWFLRAERRFDSLKISDDGVKCDSVIDAMDSTTIREVKDIYNKSLSSDNAYREFKSEVIRRFSESIEKKTKRLLEDEQMGDRKPSQFLRHLRNLAGDRISDDVLRTIWTSRLPSDIQTAIVAQQNIALDSAAGIADIVAENLALRSSNMTQQCNTICASSTSDIEDLKDIVLVLKETVRTLVNANQRDSRSRTRSQDRSRHNSARRSRSREHKNCWYHDKFKNQAHKCIKPCAFNDSQDLGNENGSH